MGDIANQTGLGTSAIDSRLGSTLGSIDGSTRGLLGMLSADADRDMGSIGGSMTSGMGAIANQASTGMGSIGSKMGSAMDRIGSIGQGLLGGIDDSMARQTGELASSGRGLVSQIGSSADAKRAAIESQTTGLMNNVGSRLDSSLADVGNTTRGDMDRIGLQTSSLLSQLNDQDATARGQLERGFQSQAGVPQSMLGQTLTGLNGMLSSGRSAMDDGMNQFYSAQLNPQNWANFDRDREALNALAGSIQGGSSSDPSQAYGQLNSLWNSSLGNQNFYDQVGGMLSPVSGLVGDIFRQGDKTAGQIGGLFDSTIRQTGLFGPNADISHWVGKPKPSSQIIRVGMRPAGPSYAA
jgi:hypothetical protein